MDMFETLRLLADDLTALRDEVADLRCALSRTQLALAEVDLRDDLHGHGITEIDARLGMVESAVDTIIAGRPLAGQH